MTGMGKLAFRPSPQKAAADEDSKALSKSRGKKKSGLLEDPFLIEEEVGLPKWTKQKLQCAKLARTSGLMICDNEGTTYRHPPLVSYAFRVTVDRPKHQLPKADEGPLHDISAGHRTHRRPR